MNSSYARPSTSVRGARSSASISLARSGCRRSASASSPSRRVVLLRRRAALAAVRVHSLGVAEGERTGTTRDVVQVAFPPRTPALQETEPEASGAKPSGFRPHVRSPQDAGAASSLLSAALAGLLQPPRGVRRRERLVPARAYDSRVRRGDFADFPSASLERATPATLAEQPVCCAGRGQLLVHPGAAAFASPSPGHGACRLLGSRRSIKHRVQHSHLADRLSAALQDFPARVLRVPVRAALRPAVVRMPRDGRTTAVLSGTRRHFLKADPTLQHLQLTGERVHTDPPARQPPETTHTPHRRGSSGPPVLLSTTDSRPGASAITVGPSAAAVAAGPASSTLKAQALTSRASERKRLAVHLVFVTWGLGVLALHLRAVTQSQQVVPGCRQVTHSWFATDYPCSVYAYNCYRQGATSPDEDSWQQLNKESLVRLTIAHCPELRMPNRLQSFPNLLGIRIHNSTIAEWTKNNAISASKHPKLTVFGIAKANMTGVSDGMLEPLPATLMDIELSHANLTSLPPDLHEKWHPLSALAPELAHTHQYFFSLLVSVNPLRELPEELGEGTLFSYVSAEHTLLKRLPEWTRTSIIDSMFLYGTPYCEDNGQYTDSRIQGDAALECVTRDRQLNGRFPLQTIDPLIPLQALPVVVEANQVEEYARIALPTFQHNS